LTNRGAFFVADVNILFSVVLRPDLPVLERELFRQYCHDIHGADGSTLLQLRCTALDASHPVFLEVEVVLPRNLAPRRLRLPHACVLLIEEGVPASPAALPVH
jgi:hypothetical protein